MLALIAAWVIGTGAPAAYADETVPRDLLTPEERAWVQAHPVIVLGAADDWAPWVMKDAYGRVSGFAVDHLELLNRRLGTDIRIEAGPWHEIVAKAEAGAIDGLTLTAPLDERRQRFDFTEPYLNSHDFIYLRTADALGRSAPATLDDLRGKRVGYLQGTLRITRVLAQRAGVTAVPAKGFAALADQLLSGEIDVAIASYAFEYWRSRNGVVGFAPNRIVRETESRIVMSIHKDRAPLVGILNKGLAGLDQTALEPLYRRWFSADFLERTAVYGAVFTPEERSWLAAHPVIRVGVDPAWAPVEYVGEDGTAHGMSIAYLDRLGKMLGTRFQIVPAPSWADTLRRVDAREVDMVTAAAATPARRERMTFTPPYLSFPAAIFSAADVAYLGGPEALRGRPVAVVRGEAVVDWLRTEWRSIPLVPVDDTREGLRKVARGDAYAFIGNLVTTSYYIGQSGLTQVKVAGETAFTYRLGMAVRNDWPVLSSVLRKGLDAIPGIERDAIYRDWIAIRYEQRVDYSLLWKLGTAVALVLAIVIYWNRRLAAEANRRRRAEAAYREAKEAAEAASRAKSAFLANVSHDLRTPLNAVLGFAALLQSDADAEKRRTHLAALSAAGKGLRQLIDDLLDLSKAEAGRLEIEAAPTNVRATLRELELMFGWIAAEKRLELRAVIGESVPTLLLLDDARLRQILGNLLSNALKFTESGRVEVRAEAVPVAAACVRLTVAVEDTGTGIPAEQLPALFEPFNTLGDGRAAHPHGTGLGLSICRRLAKLMGGDVVCDSAPGRGSTFILTLDDVPVAQGGSAAHELPGAAAKIALPPASILVADDDARSRQLIVEYLSDAPITVAQVEDGGQALDAVRRQRPDLVLMDIAMPRVGGLAAARALKAAADTRHLPIVAITAAVAADTAAEVREVFDARLDKPVAKHELIEALARLLPATAKPDAADVSLPPQPMSAALAERLRTIDPAFASLNELAALADALRAEGERTGDAALEAMARRLVRQVEAVDIAGAVETIDRLRGSSAAPRSRTRDSASPQLRRSA